MRFSGGTLSLLLTATAVTASVFQSNAVAPNRNGLQSRSLFGVAKSSNSALVNTIPAVPRGGADDSDNEAAEAPQELYLPGLLGATVGKKNVSYFLYIFLVSRNLCNSKSNLLTYYQLQKSNKSAVEDSKVVLTPKKAKELKVADGDVVAIIGRRRRATYAVASVPSKKKGSNSNCFISHNVASNLRLRDGDKLKVVALGKDAADAEERSGDMILLTKDAEVVSSVTYSPIEDSLNNLINSEGGDEIEDEELKERFIEPYLNLEDDGGSVVAKSGSVVTMKDENGRTLDFMISHVDDGEEREEGMFRMLIQSSTIIA